MTTMHVVAVTTSHRGDDARIVHRQARVLLGLGHRVTLVAPDPGDDARRLDPLGLERRIVPRASGRRRMGAWRAARRAVLSLRSEADVVLIHDLELVSIVTTMRRRGALFVWDVHEDFEAMAGEAAWIPRRLRPIVRATVGIAEAHARVRCRILLAESGYRKRFPSAPVVPNSTWTPESVEPPDDDPRVVYIGRVSVDRGAQELVALGEKLARMGGPRVVVVGQADDDCRSILADAHDRGTIEWLGPLPNPVALTVLDGALAGLSLLRDTDNYRVSLPTKVIEYLAHGVPAISTPLPQAAALIEDAAAGVVTKSWTGATLVDEVAAAVFDYAANRSNRSSEGERGWRYVRDNASWNSDGRRFVEALEGFVRSGE
ncbi:MAG: glycosyl transferase [Acidimicrobiales bacterium mtb01]|nr:glycosyltransferase family 4 protein [Actinomycetota bacterium]TEX47788.1 MAG: glycosyl transferase [Acidimicrobiales bacterium mtb01]